MTPTLEQVAQWAREEGIESVPYRYADGFRYLNVSDEQLHRLVTRAMANQAEADAKLCDGIAKMEGYPAHGYWAADDCATTIRANAPKV